MRGDSSINDHVLIWIAVLAFAFTVQGTAIVPSQEEIHRITADFIKKHTQ